MSMIGGRFYFNQGNHSLLILLSQTIASSSSSSDLEQDVPDRFRQLCDWVLWFWEDEEDLVEEEQYEHISVKSNTKRVSPVKSNFKVFGSPATLYRRRTFAFPESIFIEAAFPSFSESSLFTVKLYTPICLFYP